MAEDNTNLWAPWRMEYIQTLDSSADDDGCFLCRYWASPQDDAPQHVLWRSERAFVVMNRFPYTNGHLLIAPQAHVGDLLDLTEEDAIEITRLTREALRVLRNVLNPQGFNVGVNLGRCAGAGLPGHVHAHIVPRWSGDTNFMAIVGDVRVIPQSLDRLHEKLTACARKLGFAS